MSPGRQASEPSARQPISQTQQASSRATAALALHGLFPASLRARNRLDSLAVASSARPLTAAGTPDPSGAGFGEQLA